MKVFKRRTPNLSLSPGMTGLLTALAAAQSIFQVGLAIASRYVIDAATQHADTLLVWSLVLGGIVVILILLHSTIQWISRSVSDRCITKMQHHLLQFTTQTPPDRLRDYHSGALLTRGMDDVRTVCDGMVRVVPTLFGQILRLVGALVAVLILCPKVAPVLLVAGAAVAILTAAMRRISRQLHRNVRKSEELVSTAMQEDLRQLELIQSLQIEDAILDRFDSKLKCSLQAKHKRRIWLVIVNTIIAALALAGTGALLIWGAVEVAKGNISFGTLTAMVQLVALFRTPLTTLSSLWTQLAAVDVANDRLLEVLALAVDVTDAPTPTGKIQRIVFENVTFTYPGDAQPVLSDFSADLSLDQWVCLTGNSGIGKTTLFKLILGLYTPEKGQVYLQTTQGMFPCGTATRALFAYVPQDYALFSGTIAENLQLVAGNATEEDRKQALHQAAADFVWELKDGENTQVFENNAGLSMGQMQRLAIARALLMDRPVLLLDECTSALDAATEQAVLTNLQAAGKQVILVSHHPDALGGEHTTFVEI